MASWNLNKHQKTQGGEKIMKNLNKNVMKIVVGGFQPVATPYGEDLSLIHI